MTTNTEAAPEATTPEVSTPEVSPALQAIRTALVPVVEADLAAIAALDLEAGKVAGTMAAKRKAALEVVKANATGEDHPVHLLGTLHQEMDLLKDLMAEAEAEIEGLVCDYLKATSATSDEVAALKVQRADIVTRLEGAGKVMGSVVEVPRAPRNLGGSGTRTIGPKVDSSVGSFYVLEGDGTRKFFSKDTLAYIAFAYGVGIVDLKLALGEAGIASLTSPFEAEVTLTSTKKGGRTLPDVSNTFTVGLEVNEEAPEA